MKFEDYYECFACSGTAHDLAKETRPHWIEPRPACPEHKQQVILSHSGERVYDFLARQQREGPPYEGNGLAYILNPASLNGQRVWNDLSMGLAVYEEVFPSQTYFEYLAQHRWAESLYILHVNRGKLSEGPTAVTFYAVLLQAGIAQGGDLWAHSWALQNSVYQTMDIRGIDRVKTPDEMADVWMEATQQGIDDSFDPGMLATLLKLAEQRFSHLATGG